MTSRLCRHALIRVQVGIRRDCLPRPVPCTQLMVKQLPLVSSSPPVLVQQGFLNDPYLLAALLEQVVAVEVVPALWHSLVIISFFLSEQSHHLDALLEMLARLVLVATVPCSPVPTLMNFVGRGQLAVDPDRGADVRRNVRLVP